MTELRRNGASPFRHALRLRLPRIPACADGSEIYIRPIRDYVRTSVPVDFYTLIDAAAQRGGTAIGYRRGAFAGDKEQGHGVRLNLDKRKKIAFEAGDQILVLAED